MFVDIKQVTVKSIYDDLLEDKFITPKVVRDNPEINFLPSWKTVTNKFLDPEVRACAYRIAIVYFKPMFFFLIIHPKNFHIVHFVVADMKKL